MLIMLNSYTRSPKQNGNLKNTRNESTLSPGITSTPLITPNRSPLVTPARKLLGNRRYSLSSNGYISPVRAGRSQPGPLLASTNFNVNLSTYIDTKSPGFARRLVQYNEESCRRPQYTHQEKYDSPGQLPIVHLFKKDVPVLSPKSRKPTIRIGTPEHKSPYSQEHNRLLLEGIIRNNSSSKPRDNSSSDSTRSVLDALKEISRKRIHASEEYEIIDEANKKLKRDCVISDNGESSKRNRMDSPTSDNSTSPPISQPKKRVCTIDAVLASRTSSMYELPKSTYKKRIVRDSGTTTQEAKKFHTVETQTSEPLISNKDKKLTDEYISNENKKTETIRISSEENDKPAPPAAPPLKIFDDRPLEIIRKNRLAALLSALTGKEIPRIPMIDRRKALEESWARENADKGFDTILTKNQEKSSGKVEKHVTFSIPEKETETAKIPEANQTEKVIEVSKPSEPIKASVPILKIVSPVSESKSKEATPSTIDKNEKTTPVLGGFKLDTPKSTPSSLGGFKFDLNKPISSDKSLTDNKSAATSIPSVILTPKTSETKVGLSKTDISSSFAPSTTTVSSFLTNFNEPSPSKNALGLPSSLPQNPVMATPSFTLQTTVSSAPSTQNSLPSFNFGKTDAPKSLPSFGIPTTTSNITTTTSKSSISTTPSFVSPTINFGKSKSAVSSPNSTNLIVSAANPIMVSAAPFNPSVSNNFSKPIPTSTTSNSFSSTPSSFGTTSNAPSFATTSTIAPPSFNFSTTTPAFGQVSTPNSFGTTAAPTNSFGTTSAPTYSFGTTSAPSNSFGTTAASPTTGSFVSTQNSFGATSAPSNSFGTTTTTGSFVSPFSTNTNPMFGSTTTVASFGVATSSNTFTSNTKPFAFGTNNQSFNSSNHSSMLTKNSQSSMTLGTNTTASSASSVPFGTTSPTFGGLNNATPSLFPAKNSTVPSFATTTTPTFGATTTSSGFSNNYAANNSFGKSNTVPSFGTTTTTTSALFGVNNTPSFGAPNTSSFGASTLNFGAPSTTSSGFGTNSTNNVPFGSTTASSMFGTTNVQSFGTTSSGFGTTNTPSFGASNSFSTNFGGSSAPFGNPTTTSSSFSNNIASPFSSSSGGSSFNAFGTANSPFNPITTASSFGANNSFGNPTNTFGNSSSSTNNFNAFGSSASTASNAFGGGGTNNNMPTSNGFDSGFGASVSKSEPSTHFSSTQGSNNIFNSSFGASSSSNAPTNGVFTFGAPNAQSSSSGGVFAFGGGEAPKTFNFNAPGTSNNNNNARGGFPTQSPSFGGAGNNVPNMFSIGSGSTSSSSQNRNSRPLARAKRRY